MICSTRLREAFLPFAVYTHTLAVIADLIRDLRHLWISFTLLSLLP